MPLRSLTIAVALAIVAAMAVPAAAQDSEGRFAPSAWEIPFPFTPVGQTSPTKRVTVTNSGSGALTFRGVERGGLHPEDFVVVSDACNGQTVQPQASCFVDLAFRPTEEDTRMATVRFDHDGEHCQHWIHVAGGGTPSSNRVTARAASHCPNPAANTSTTGSSTTSTTAGSSGSASSGVSGSANSLDVVRIPSARSCNSRRSFDVRLRKPRGASIREVSARIRGKRRLKTLRGKEIKATVNLRGLPRGRFTLEVRMLTSKGRTIVRTRRYVTCVQDKTA